MDRKTYNLDEIEYVIDKDNIVHMCIFNYDNMDKNGDGQFTIEEVDTMSEDDYLKLLGGYTDTTSEKINIKTHNTYKKEFIEKINELRSHGISDKILLNLIRDSHDTEPIFIDRNYRVHLKDKDMTEIKMCPLTRVLFLFYINHPEGVALKELMDHYDELYSIYQKITNREDKEKVKKSINKLVCPIENSANEKLANLRAAFRSKVPASAVGTYTPEGEKGERRVIKIDRNLIEWERPLLLE